MSLSSVQYIFREAFKSLRRNVLISLASTGTMAITLLVAGIFFLILVNTQNITSNLESDIEISVSLKDGLSSQAIEDVGKKIKSIPGVAEERFISKDQALADLKKKLGRREIFEAMGGQNPLPHVYRVKVENPRQVNDVAAKIEKLPGIEKVNYGREIVERLFAITRWLRLIGYVLMALLALATLFLVGTTIRLAFFARRKEIQIMKFIGATNWFIRWPFLVEGIVIGLVGSLLAAGLLAAAYFSLLNYVYSSPYLAFIPLRDDRQFLILFFSATVASGIVLGALGSIISLHRYLKV